MLQRTFTAAVLCGQVANSLRSLSFAHFLSLIVLTCRFRSEQRGGGRSEDVFVLRDRGVHGARGGEQEGPWHHCRLVVLRSSHGADDWWEGLEVEGWETGKLYDV